MGPSLYSVYMFAQYVVGPGYLEYPRVVLFHLGLFVLSGYVAVRAWNETDAASLPAMNERLSRRWAMVLFLIAAFVVLRYIPSIVGSFSETAIAPEFQAEPAMFWTIFILDLGVVVPSAIATGVGLRNRRAGSMKAFYAVVAWFALVPPTVLAMAIVMVLNGDEYAAAGSLAIFMVAAIASTALAICAYRPLFARQVSGGSTSELER